jgi:fimbrial chaperone protein
LGILFCALSQGGESATLQAKAVFKPQGEVSVISVTPRRLVIPPGAKTGTVSVVNGSEVPRRYMLWLIDQAMDESGAMRRQDNFSYAASPMIKFVPREFAVQPGERQVVRVLVSRPEGLADGDYHSHLVFREVLPGGADEAGGGGKAPYGIAMPLVVQQGRVESALDIGGAHLGEKTPGAPRRLIVELTRRGNAEASGKLGASYAGNGQKPLEIMRPQKVYLYREVEKISREFDVPLLPENAAGGKIIVYLMRDENDESKTVRREITVD